MKKGMFTAMYLIFGVFFVGVVLWLAGGKLSGDWLTISKNWAGLFPYLVGLSISAYWFIRRRG